MVTQGPTKWSFLKPLINSSSTSMLNFNSFQRLCGPSKNLISDFVIWHLFQTPSAAQAPMAVGYKLNNPIVKPT